MRLYVDARSFSRPLHGLCNELTLFPSDESQGYFQSSAKRGLGGKNE
jgi:hypothetical protein